MSSHPEPAAPEEQRLAAALDRIAGATARLRRPPGAPAHPVAPGMADPALAPRLDALIAELRGVLGTEA